MASLFPERNYNELIYAEFIKSKLQMNGGSLELQNIFVQLSLLEPSIRSGIGNSSKKLRIFLKKYNDIFAVNDGLVSLKNPSGNEETSAAPKDINVDGKSEKESDFPEVLNDVPGIVMKVKPTFGFITIKEPVKASVYFTLSCFNDGNRTLSLNFEIVPGQKVRLNAEIGNLDLKSKYRATKVWIPENVRREVLHPEVFLPKVPKTRETRLDTDRSEGRGTIQKVFDSFGFISIEGDLNNTVFFHINSVCKVENLCDLTKIFHPGDLVNYKAVRSKKQSIEMIWEATEVWRRKKRKTKSKKNGESVAPDYESISSQSKNSELQKSSDSSDTDFKKTKSKFDSKEISSETGKIYRSAKGTVIKFGEKDSKLAAADSCLLYIHKVKVEDESWEFIDGDVVKFDGVKSNSPPGYKALLAWVGDKPDIAPIALGDFPEHSNEDIEDVPENESYISKTSTSALSETNLNLSETKRQNVYCRSKASSRESVNSLSSNLKNKLKPNPDLFKNRGDTPYPDDDDAEVSKIPLKAHVREGIQRKNSNYSSGNVSSGKSRPYSDETDKEIVDTADNLVIDDFYIKTLLNVRDKVSDKCDQVTSSFSSYDGTELYLSNDKFSDTLEEANENILKALNDLNEEDTETQKKPKSYFKRFQDLDGHVKKVSCKFAVIQNDRLKKCATFFWTDMYHNGIHVPDQYDDLKKVLSHGQTVKFNCFEVVDDVGAYFLKVTMVWKGSKPKITEMIPEKFIAVNNICFSGNEIYASEDLVESNCFESMNPLNAGSAPTAAPRKFLNVGNMNDEDDSDEKKDQPGPSEDLQVITLKEDSDSNLNTQEYVDLRENILSSSENMDTPQLADGATGMLGNFKNSRLDSIMLDLIHMTLSAMESEEIQSSQTHAIPSFESTETNQSPERVDSSAQTLATGEIFSENLFTL